MRCVMGTGSTQNFYKPTYQDILQLSIFRIEINKLKYFLYKWRKIALKMLKKSVKELLNSLQPKTKVQMFT